MSVDNFDIDYCVIEGDGIGPEITKASKLVGDCAYKKVWGEAADINWIHLDAGQESMKKNGTGLPQETIDAIAHYKLAMKGPMGTPIGQGTRSFNVALRKDLDLYACIRPLNYYHGVPTMHIAPRGIKAVLFRENIEDLYSGAEVQAGDKKTIEWIKYTNEMFGRDIPEESSIGIKHISEANTKRLIRAAADYAKKYNYENLTLMHKGNIMKYTEGAFRNWGYDVIKNEYPEFITERQLRILKNRKKGLSIQQNAQSIEGSNYHFKSLEEQKKIQHEIISTLSQHWNGDKPRKSKKVVNDLIADNTLQQVFLNPHQFGVIAATNLNGDYLSDAFAAVVGGLGISPGANVNFETDTVLVEATHGTAEKLSPDAANPLSHMLSMKMGFELKGYQKVADLIEQAIVKQLLTGRVTGDLKKTAQDTLDRVLNQKDNSPTTPGITHLFNYAEEQNGALTTIGTQRFAEEICEKIHDIPYRKKK